MNNKKIGIKTGHTKTKLFWVLKNVDKTIDMNRMSTSHRRDFPSGVSGCHMATEPQTCFTECDIDLNHPQKDSYLLTFKADLSYADYRGFPDEAYSGFSGLMYGPQYDFSQTLFIDHSGDYSAHRIVSIRRLSAKCLRTDSTHHEVFALFPEAAKNLVLESITPIGDPTHSVDFIPHGKSTPLSSAEFSSYCIPLDQVTIDPPSVI